MASILDDQMRAPNDLLLEVCRTAYSPHTLPLTKNRFRLASPDLQTDHQSVNIGSASLTSSLGICAPNHGKLWKSLMHAYLGDYETLEARLRRCVRDDQKCGEGPRHSTLKF